MSLFKLLSDHHTEAVVDLSYQYRMNADIMSLSNTLIYNNRLKCGTEIVANQSLELSEGNSHGCESDSCWISHALQPRSVGRSAYECESDALAVRKPFSLIQTRLLPRSLELEILFSIRLKLCSSTKFVVRLSPRKPDLRFLTADCRAASLRHS